VPWAQRSSPHGELSARKQKAWLKDIYVQRKWLDFYGGVMAHRNGNSDESDLTHLSPDCSAAEIAHLWDGNEFSESYLLADVLGLDLTTIHQLNCPFMLFAGRHDVNVNSDVATAWFARRSKRHRNNSPGSRTRHTSL